MVAKLSETYSAKLAEARAAGMTDLVIINLDVRSSCSHAIYEDLHGVSMIPRDTGDNDHGAVEILTRADAIRLLRKHGKATGNLYGDLLQRRDRAEYSVVVLLEDTGILQTITERRTYATYTMGYERLMLRLHQSTTQAGMGKNMLYLLELDNGETVPLCGPASIPLMTGLLTVLGATRKMWVVRKGKFQDIEAFDSDLAAELLTYEDRPDVIAEAIRALRKMGGDRDRWMTGVLWGRRPLRVLARRVESELTGCENVGDC